MREHALIDDGGLTEFGQTVRENIEVATDTPARIVMVEACPGKPGGLLVLPPLFERDAKGYTPEVASLLAGALIAPPRTGDRARSRTPLAR